MNWRYLADLGERAGRSFLQGFLGLWLANPSKPVEFDTLFTVENLKAGVVMAVLSVGMGLLGKGVNNPDSASLLPPQAQPPAPKPADPTLEPSEAAPAPAGSPEISNLLTSSPQRQPVGLIDPNLAGGRDPRAEYHD